MEINNKPRRSLSAYHYFCKTNSGSAVQNSIHWNELKSNPSKKDELERYNEMARIDLERYSRDVANYKSEQKQLKKEEKLRKKTEEKLRKQAELHESKLNKIKKQLEDNRKPVQNDSEDEAVVVRKKAVQNDSENEAVVVRKKPVQNDSDDDVVLHVRRKPIENHSKQHIKKKIDLNSILRKVQQNKVQSKVEMKHESSDDDEFIYRK